MPLDNSTDRKPRFSRAWAEPFLTELAETGNVSRAAAAAGIHRDSAYQYRKSEPAFADAWAQAIGMGGDALEDEARRRAVEGWDEPVFHRGEQCGTVRRYSDRLLIVLLAATKPKKFRRNIVMQAGDPKGEPSPVRILPESDRH